MTTLLAAAAAEWLKIRKAAIFPISIAAMCLLPGVCGLFLAISLSPGSVGGLLAQKAQAMGAPDWAGYFGMLNEMISVGGVVIFGFLTSWAFGREYSDQTAKDLLALPMPRSIIVVAKYLALAAWGLLLTLIAVVFAVAIGLIINPPGFSLASLGLGSAAFVTSALLTLALITPVSFVASAGKGYLAPLGFIILTVLIGQIAEVLGVGGYFPWDLPAIYSGVASDAITLAGLVLFVALVAAGVGATLAWWRYADQK